MNVCHNMDEHWIYYAELMKPAIDKTTSKEKFNLIGLDDSFPKQTSGIIGEICICANYKLLYDL